MFCWGNSPIGDYVVLSEDSPYEEDLSMGSFNPGVRFYFRYEDIIEQNLEYLIGMRRFITLYAMA